MTQPPQTTDDVGFAAVYHAQFAVLVRLAYVTTGSATAAEDLVQDAFVEFLRRRAEIDQPAAWLRRAVVSRGTSWVRRRVVERRYADRAHVTEVAAAVGPEVVAVRRALARLRPRHRAAVFLRYYLDLSESAIAETLGCRPATVRSLLHRGLTALKEHLNES